MAVYIPSAMAFTFGPVPITGFAEGSMIEITPIGDGTKVIQGTQGETCFIKTSNKRAEITFRLMENAFANSALAAYVNTVDVPIPVFLSSLSTGAVAVAGVGGLERVPGVTYDGNVPVRAWKILCPHLEQQMIPPLLALIPFGLVL